MTAAFIVTLDTASDTDLPSIAIEVQDALEKEGIVVLQVHPWARPTQQPASLLPPPETSL